MDHSDDETANNTSVIDTSTFCNGDLDMFLDCLEELCKTKKSDKTKSAQKSRHSGGKKRIPLQRIYSSDTSVAGSFDDDSSISNLNLTDWNDTNTSFSTTNNDISLNDTDVSHLTEKFNDIFAYFNEDVVTDKSLFEDDDKKFNDDVGDDETAINSSSDKENIVDNRKKIFEKKLSKRDNTKRNNSAVKEIQHKSSAIFNSIKSYNNVNNNNNNTNSINRNNTNKNVHVEANREPIMAKRNERNFINKNDSRLNYTVSDLPPLSNENYLSTVSTLSLYDAECDRRRDIKHGKLPNVNVREKIDYFNSAIAETNCNISLPAMHSSSRIDDNHLDEETQLYRTNSIRKFREKRDYFEKIFDASKMMPAHEKNNNEIARNEKNKLELNIKYAKEDYDTISPVVKKYDSKLNAVETYVQTQHLLERIQTLVKAISNLDEKRLNTMNLKMLKKFLIFIRDCSYKCQEVCFDISENFLTDFEKNVLSAEELLYSVMKTASHSQVTGF